MFSSLCLETPPDAFLMPPITSACKSTAAAKHDVKEETIFEVSSTSTSSSQLVPLLHLNNIIAGERGESFEMRENQFTQRSTCKVDEEVGPQSTEANIKNDSNINSSSKPSKKKKRKKSMNPSRYLTKSYMKAMERAKQIKLDAKKMELKRQQRRLVKTPRSMSVKEVLRQKFVEQAKKYIGTPYAKKYQPRDAPECSLYLDCCGLIRQVLVDLQKDFGFIPGNWNQAYQFDTLPVRVDSVDQLLPGDLIFYAGEYTSPRSKKQRYNMTHVEIFLGGETGEATIGARFLRGTVDIFPSYKFASSLWNLEKYYFCSIDTWLNGECISHNPFPPPRTAPKTTRSPLTKMRF